MRTLALDLSSKSTGWSIFEDGKYIASGCIKASSTNVITRIFAIVDKIHKQVMDQYNIDYVIMEEVLPNVGHNNNTNVWKALTWLQAAVCFMLYQNFPKVNKEFILPNSWRAKLGIHTGRGVKRETLKEAEMNYVKEHYNLKVDDDEADAICINEAYYSTVSNEINWE